MEHTMWVDPSGPGVLMEHTMWANPSGSGVLMEHTVPANPKVLGPHVVDPRVPMAEHEW